MYQRPPLAVLPIAGALAVALLLAAASPAAALPVDPALLAGMEARAIGPAGMSGRVADIAAHPDEPATLYVGAATGGLWKSTNAGQTWEPIFDDQPVASIGAVAIDPNNPDVVWVGTGEGNPRNSVSVGNGIYKSLDGGRSWRHLGLAETERIHRIVLHPTEPGVAWVAALGKMWGENPERGVFKTTDGGDSWEKVLYVDEKSGAADLVIDPRNPDKLFAALWDYRRWPWFFRSGGPGSGLYVTYDGGGSWKRFTEDDGLPEGDLGRIGIAVCAGQPQVVYALVEAAESALLRSADGGESWRAVNTDQGVANRPFYYADIRCDPEWPNRLYNLASRATVSDDGGKSFERMARGIHSDYHALWINPGNPSHLVIGNDGGIAISHDRGETWAFVTNLPLAQYYHIAVDNETPYNVYGGMQDNGSWRGPSAVHLRGGWFSAGGIPSHAWQRVGFGDGFDTLPDPDDASRGYAMWQGGNLLRWDLDGGGKPIKPPEDGAEELRFNWNAAIEIDPFDPATVYYGSQYVHKSTDRGASWQIISPDLTTDTPEWQNQSESGGLTPDVTGAENFTSLVALAASPLEPGVLWAGSDDGRLHVTRDGGESWESVEDKVPGVPEHTWIPHIEPSRHDAGEAFVVFDDHRRSNWTPYVYRTRDYGATWTDLATDELSGYALSIVQDPVDRDLLFLGTEFGLWVSTDGGGSWVKWTHGVPTVSVMDLVLHPRDHDLVLGTHGRAAYVLDDVAPLRHLDEAGGQPLHLFPIPPARQFLSEPVAEGNSLGATEFYGENRPYGALISFWLEAEGLPHPDEEMERERKEAERQEKRRQQAEAAAEGEAGGEEEGAEAAEERGPRAARRGRGGRGGWDQGPKAKIEVVDTGGETVRTFEAPVHRGLNRATWDLGRDGYPSPPRSEPSFFDDRSGPEVAPGRYSVRLSYGDHQAEGEVEVLADPDSTATAEDWQAREAALERVAALRTALADAIGRIHDTRRDLEVVTRLAKEAGEEEDDEAAEESEEQAGSSESDGEGHGEEGEEKGANPHQQLIDDAKEIQQALSELEKVFWETEDTKGIVRRAQLEWDIGYAERSITATWDAPTATDLAYLDRAEARLGKALADLNTLFEEKVAPYREQVQASGLTLLPQADPVEIEPTTP